MGARVAMDVASRVPSFVAGLIIVNTFVSLTPADKRLASSSTIFSDETMTADYGRKTCLLKWGFRTIPQLPAVFSDRFRV
jgi:hypothetical protein